MSNAFMERQIQSLQSKIVRHGMRLVIFLLVGVLAAIITRELGRRLDAQIMIGRLLLQRLEAVMSSSIIEGFS